MANCLGLSMAVCITEVSLIRRAVIERFHCASIPRVGCETLELDSELATEADLDLITGNYSLIASDISWATALCK